MRIEEITANYSTFNEKFRGKLLFCIKETRHSLARVCEFRYFFESGCYFITWNLLNSEHRPTQSTSRDTNPLILYAMLDLLLIPGLVGYRTFVNPFPDSITSIFQWTTPCFLTMTKISESFFKVHVGYTDTLLLWKPLQSNFSLWKYFQISSFQQIPV